MHKYEPHEVLNPEENISILKCITEDCFYTHTHNFIEVVYIISGIGRHYIDNICYPAERGDLLFINFNQTHSFNVTGSMTYVNCLIKPEFLSGELINSENAFEILALSSFREFNGKISSPIPKVSFRGKELIEVETIITHMLEEFSRKAIGYRSVLKGYLSVLLSKVFREMGSSDISELLQHVNRITPDIIKYIEDKCFEKISLNELAQKCFYNPSYFSRIFKECYGKSFMEFVHEKRVNEAMRLLKESTLSIEAICSVVGYSDKKQFYKIFRKYLGVTPSKVREAVE